MTVAMPSVRDHSSAENFFHVIPDSRQLTWLDLANFRQVAPTTREQIPSTTSLLLNWREMGLMDRE